MSAKGLRKNGVFYQLPPGQRGRKTAERGEGKKRRRRIEVERERKEKGRNRNRTEGIWERTKKQTN